MKNKTRYIFIALAVFAGFFLVQAIVSTVFAIVDMSIISSTNHGASLEEINKLVYDKVMSQSTLLTLISDVVAVIIAYVVFSYPNKKFANEIGLFKTKFVYIPVVIVMGLSIYVLLATGLTLLPLPDSWWDSYYESMGSVDMSISFLNVLTTTIIAPITEEILFRGLIFTRFSKALGVPAGIILSGIIFGIAHGNLIWICYASIIGMLLALIFYITKSLYCSICIHIAFNTLGMFLENVNTIVIIISIIGFALSAVLIYLISRKNAITK